MVLFWSGFAGMTPGDFYSEVHSKIAAHGMIVVSVFAPESPDYDKHPNTTIGLIDYLLTGAVTKEIAERKGHQGVFLNVTDQLVLMGHSAGGHVVCNYVKNGCTQSAVPKAMIMWDPVDSFKSSCSSDGVKVPFTIPTLIIGSDYWWNLCAPEGLSYPRFEAAWNCPRWTISPKDFGHLDMMDPLARATGNILCGGNVLATPAQIDANQHLWAGATVALIKSVVQDQCDYIKYIEQAVDYIPEKAGPISQSSDVACINGPGTCPKPSCSNSKILKA